MNYAVYQNFGSTSVSAAPDCIFIVLFIICVYDFGSTSVSADSDCIIVEFTTLNNQCYVFDLFFFVAACKSKRTTTVFLIPSSNKNISTAAIAVTNARPPLF